MRNVRFSTIFAVLVLSCTSSSAHAQECFNTAYRYCCDIITGFVIPCPGAPGGICQGDVVLSEFAQTLILGGMTYASFEQIGTYKCRAYFPICNPSEPYCDYEENWNEALCPEWQRKTQWQWCPILP